MNQLPDPAALKLANEVATLLRLPPVGASGVLVVNHARYVSVKLAAHLTGRTEKALRRKIEDGKWIEGREYRRDPDGMINVDMKGVERWVEASK